MNNGGIEAVVVVVRRRTVVVVVVVAIFTCLIHIQQQVDSMGEANTSIHTL